VRKKGASEGFGHVKKLKFSMLYTYFICAASIITKKKKTSFDPEKIIIVLASHIKLS
jgi:hypothetical protein